MTLAAGEVEAARAAADELMAIAAHYGMAALQASSLCAHGAVLLAEREDQEAVRALRSGSHLWSEVEAPYENARARVLLAKALMAGGDNEAAALELLASRNWFERLGALGEARQAAELAEQLSVK